MSLFCMYHTFIENIVHLPLLREHLTAAPPILLSKNFTLEVDWE